MLTCCPTTTHDSEVDFFSSLGSFRLSASLSFLEYVHKILGGCLKHSSSSACAAAAGLGVVVWLAKKVISVLSTFFRSQLDGFWLQFSLQLSCCRSSTSRRYILCTSTIYTARPNCTLSCCCRADVVVTTACEVWEMCRIISISFSIFYRPRHEFFASWY